MKRPAAITWALSIMVALWSVDAEAAPRTRPKPSSADATAKKVDVFKAVDDRQVQMQVLAQGAGSAVLTLTNVSEEPLNVEVPLALAAVPQLPKGVPTPQTLAIGVNPQWAAGVDKKNRKTNVRPNKKAKAGDDDAKDDKKPDDDKDAKKEEKKTDSFVALVPLLPGATQQLPLFTLGLDTPDKKAPPVAGSPYALAELDKVSQAPELKKLLEQFVQGKVPQDTAQILAWHYHGRLDWDQMANSGLALAPQLEIAKQYAEIVEGRASPDTAPQPQTTKKKKR